MQAERTFSTDPGASSRVPVVLATLHAVLFIASLIIVPVLAPSAHIPNPFGPDEPSRRFFLDNASAIRVSDWLQLASAMCLAALAAVWNRLSEERTAPRRSAGLILSGGLGAAVLLILAVLASWALASPGAIDPGSAFRALQFMPFLMGGPGWAAFFSLFMLGVAQSGNGQLPRWMVWSGFALAATSLLATLVLLTLAAAPFLPISRFLGFLWLIAAAVLLSRTRQKTAGTQ